MNKLCSLTFFVEPVSYRQEKNENQHTVMISNTDRANEQMKRAGREGSPDLSLWMTASSSTATSRHTNTVTPVEMFGPGAETECVAQKRLCKNTLWSTNKYIISSVQMKEVLPFGRL